MSSLLEVEQLVSRYGRDTAVDKVSFAVEEGESVGVIGPNGAGKSTLLATIVGLKRAESGYVRFDGRDITKNSPEELVNAGIVLVPEGRHIFGTLTVSENLALGLSSKRARSKQKGRIAEVLEVFPVLERYFSRTAATLSGGEQQQLAIARAIVASPRVILLDEPSLGLAPMVVQGVMDALARLQEQGTTLVLVEQNAMSTISFCTQTHVLRNGQIVLTGTSEDLHDQKTLINHYLGGER